MLFFFFFQAEDGIRDLVRSRGLGDVYKRQIDTSLKIIIGEISAQFYFFKDWDPGHKRTEPDTIRLQQIKFWSKYQ